MFVCRKSVISDETIFGFKWDMWSVLAMVTNIPYITILTVDWIPNSNLYIICILRKKHMFNITNIWQRNQVISDETIFGQRDCWAISDKSSVGSEQLPTRPDLVNIYCILWIKFETLISQGYFSSKSVLGTEIKNFRRDHIW